MSMTLFDDELTLPGVITQVVPDYSSGYDTSAWGTTESVTIIGTAFNGPVGKPVQIATPEQAKYIFGDSFDPATKREATLVAEIYDAWQRGCRTIYAVRVSGDEMFKDFDLAVESNLKLRVSGLFPSNDNKACFMTFACKQGSSVAFGENEGIIKIYKPGDKTTIDEKIAGIVDSIDELLVTTINLDENGFERGSRLSDLLDVINNNAHNNVLRVDLVDKDGVPRTNSDPEVQQLTVAAMFPGIYTICRDEIAEGVKLTTDIKVVGDQALVGAENEPVWKHLIANTNPAKPYPIFAENVSVFDKLLPSGIVVDENFDFLNDTGVIDRILVANDVDYEGVDVTGFELYQKLGSGFARTACLKKLGVDKDGKPRYKVIAAPDGDKFKVVGINDGIYSVLQMHESDYVVLAAATAETDLSAKLPKKRDFLFLESNKGIDLKAEEEKIMNISCKVDNKKLDAMPCKYDFKIASFPGDKNIKAKLMEDQTLRLPCVSAGAVFEHGVERGQLAFVLDKGIIQVFDGEKFVDAEDGMIEVTRVLVEEAGVLKIFEKGTSKTPEGAPVFEAKDTPFTNNEGDFEYMVAFCDDKALVYKKAADGKIIPFMSLKDLADGVADGEDFMLVAAEPDIPVLDKDNVTFIHIYSDMMDYCTVEEMAKELNECVVLEDRFLFECAEEKDQDELEGLVLVGKGSNLELDEHGNVVTSYDTTLHIPYTTTDNFARHLAQHCLYTSLKSYPTHGVIGCDRLQGISLNNIANRVNEICNMDLDMYAKKSNGRNMYDANNEPHPIGRCLSVTFMQYTVTTGNGYYYISSGAAGYAGMVSTLDPERSSTNQPFNIDSLQYTLSNAQLTRLNTAGIVCCKESTTLGIVIVDGITQAPATSVYRRLSTTKIINAVGRILKEVIEPYIGLPRTLSYLNAMETAIKSALNKIVGVLINDYSFEIVTDSASARLGVVKIDYAILPAYEIREVRNTITVTENAINQ